MARKLPDSDGDSQKENGGVRPPMSKTKVKTELRGGGAANRGAGRVDTDDERDTGDLPRGKRRGSTLVSDSGEEDGQNAVNSDDDEDVDANGSPNGLKRARINEEGDGIPVKKEETIHRPRRVTLPRDRDGYVPGSIVRVQLENFVTYDWVEFRPGPNLNMILGPNGTGKSSIACAICIGLNGAPSLLGRSNELNAFVKHGHNAGYIEIELKGRIGTPNLVIRRNINAKNRSSQFTLNGQHVPAREVSDRIAELNVQVGNLCSFLPQDRVSEFAQMSSQQLLKETQRTAGDENLTLWHGMLIEKGKEFTVAQNALKEENKHLAQLEEKQRSLEKDVKRFRERQAIEHNIELFNIVLPYVKYRDSKVHYDEAKAARAKAGADYKRLEAANKPLKDLQVELNAEFDSLTTERSKLKKEVTEGYKRTITALEARNNKASSQAEEAREALKSLKRKEKDRQKNILKAKDDIVKLQEKVDNPPEYEDVNAINAEIEPIRAQHVDIRVKRQEIKGQIDGLMRDSGGNNERIQRAEHELQKLDNLKDRKLNTLRNWDSDCASVIMWLEQHKETNAFAHRVSLPAFVSLTVRDQRYADAVEACLSANQIKTFVTHSEEDFKTFNRLFIDTPEALGKKARVTVWYRPQNEAQLARPPMDVSELKSIGFDGYVIDYVECPEGLKWFLVKELNMHRTPVALDARRVDENRAQEALSRQSPDGRPSLNCSYIAGETLGMVSRSAYGQRKSMNTTRNIGRARNLVDPTGDPAAKRQYEQQISQLKEQNEGLGKQAADLASQDSKLEAKLQELRKPHDALVERKKAANDIIQKIKTNESKLASIKTHLKDLESRPPVDKERSKHEATVEKSVKERSKVLNEFIALTQTLVQKHTRLTTMCLQQIQLKAKVEAIDTLCEERTSEAKRVKEEYNEACTKFVEAKAESGTMLEQLRTKLDTVDVALKDEFTDLEKEDQQRDPADRWTPETVEEVLETERAKLDLNHATDSGVIAQFEARERKIESLRDTVKEKEKKVQKLEEKIKKTRDLWYPALTALVTAVGEKFSAAFDRIGRAGEIRIKEEDDYDKWAIEIYVKFRDEEPLTLLTAQRQSGGERSLTTIMYLMSLTEHARAPFSLVDEINQGMDQQYERSVHNQLVNVTCNADSGQYFLITPKLLPGLEYHKSMKVLFVNNGEWLPDAKTVAGNMGRMIDNVEKRRTTPSAS